MFGVSNAEGGDHGGYHYIPIYTILYQRVGNQPALAEILLTPTLAAAVAMARAPGNGRVSVDDYPMVSGQKMGLGRTSPNVYERGVSKVVSRCILGSIQCLLKLHLQLSHIDLCHLTPRVDLQVVRKVRSLKRSKLPDWDGDDMNPEPSCAISDPQVLRFFFFHSNRSR